MAVNNGSTVVIGDWIGQKKREMRITGSDGGTDIIDMPLGVVR